MTTEIEDKEMVAALDQIARTPDGQLFYRYLQKTLCGVITGDADERALRLHEGRRRFAAELMAHMAEGIADSDRYAITFSSTSRSERKPVIRGAARRVGPGTRIDGWDVPDTEPVSTTGPGSGSSN